jgi:formylmethanofuran dehydrogenase subunit E
MTHWKPFPGPLSAGSLILALLASPPLGAAGADQAEAKPAPGAQPALVHSHPGENAWNAGQAAGDWWDEIKRQHGHVGPWNVLGWRIGQAALRELKSPWGRHELEVICYVPLLTPFTCMADGLSVGTGNSLGRLDLRLAEVLDYRQSFVAVRRKDGQGDILEFRPHASYLKSITGQPVEALERLSRACSQRGESELFEVRRWAGAPAENPAGH